jgi:hypothetical protein
VLLSKLVDSLGSGQDQLDPAERRLSVRLLDYWNELRGDKRYPSPDDIHFETVPELAEFGFTMSIPGGDGAPKIHYLGSALRDHINMFRDGAAVGETDNKPLSLALNDAIRRYADVTEREGPVAFESDSFDVPGTQFAYRAIILPFSRDDAHIDFILGAIRYKEKLSEATLPQAPTFGLASSLQECRDLAIAWQTEEKKSRAALYETLERAYQFEFETQDDPGAFMELCTEAGINHQARAPLTPVVKLVFGADYDKTRISEYAACLAYAKRMGREAGTLRALIEETEGGIKGCVKAERALRREEQGDKTNKSNKYKEVLRELNPLIDIFDGSGGSEEFVLLLARRAQSDRTKLHILCALDEKPSVVEPIAKRAARGLKAGKRTKSKQQAG